ncbi:hypothetical protein SDC9_185736 [bioreactor metagenome]|uniref:Uncharacterized protein n=1 Tax=bioreactor metagenome TaxID=1076179 RepID=A0A645HII2_9ZZZZ
MSVADNLILQPVILGIDAAGQHKHTIRQLCLVLFAPAHVGILILQVAAVLPQLSEARIEDNLQLLGRSQRVEIGLHDGGPALPGRDKSIQPEGSAAPVISIRILSDPLGIRPRPELHGLFVRNAPAVGAYVANISSGVVAVSPRHLLLLIKADVRKLDVVKLLAVRTGNAPALHRALGEACLNG